MSESIPAELHVGCKVKDKQVQAISTGVGSVLAPRERILAIFYMSVVHPLVTNLVVTSARALGVNRVDLPRSAAKAIRFSVDRREITSVERHVNRIGFVRDRHPELRVEMRRGSTQSLGGIRDDDWDDLVRFLTAPVDHAVAEGLAALAACTTREQEAVAAQAAANRQAAVDHVARITKMALGRIGAKQAEEIAASSASGEEPKFVIAEGASGALAAFDDRCIIVKKGALTSWMTGSFGGGRVATFMYSDITGIEYNAGWSNGVLEILTASYQGSANKDFWRGTNQSRNADSNDPFTLSNTLPLSKSLHERVRPQLDQMRRLIAATKGGQIGLATPPPPQAGLGDELEQLAQLHEQGDLDADEFKSAKRAAIARHSSPD